MLNWAVGLALLIALTLLLWFGLDRVRTRWTDVGTGAALHDSRLSLWSRSLKLVREFPVWGTGLGTYQYVEPLYREDTADGNLAYEFAHNDYLEALVEGGLIRLALTVLAVGLVFQLGWRSVPTCAGPAGPVVGPWSPYGVRQPGDS